MVRPLKFCSHPGIISFKREQEAAANPQPPPTPNYGNCLNLTTFFQLGTSTWSGRRSQRAHCSSGRESSRAHSSLRSSTRYSASIIKPSRGLTKQVQGFIFKTSQGALINQVQCFTYKTSQGAVINQVQCFIHSCQTIPLRFHFPRIDNLGIVQIKKIWIQLFFKILTLIFLQVQNNNGK